MNRPIAPRKVCRSRTWSGLHAFEATYQPNSILAEHVHQQPLFTLVLRGEFDEVARGIRRGCRQGSVIFRAAGETHTNVVGAEGTSSLNVEIQSRSWEAFSGLSDFHGRVLNGDVQWPAFAVWREFHRDDHASELAMEESLALLCSAVRSDAERSRTSAARRINAAAEYIGDGLKPLSGLIEVSEMVGVHPMHLAKLFRRRFGCSMGEYARRRRVAWACGQLLDEERTISAVGLAAGFADHAHFTRTFRRITGWTPKEYRARMNGLTRPDTN
jgi:AraC family transcriptional regulator